MRTILALCLAAATLLLGACATTGADPNYAAYVQFVEAREAAREARLAGITAAADRCTDDRCVEHVAAVAAIAAVSGAGQGATLQPYQRQPSTAERIGLALVGQIAPLASAAVAWHSSDNSRDIALGQYDFLGGVIGSVVNSPALQSPSITVGGDYVPGRVGDNVGGDMIGGNQHHGDAIGGDQVGGDQIGGDRVDGDGNYNEGRYYSPGPIDESGDRCTGDTCQGQPPDPPPPEVDPGDGG